MKCSGFVGIALSISDMHTACALITRRSFSFLCKNSSAKVPKLAGQLSKLGIYSAPKMHLPAKYYMSSKPSGDDQALLTTQLAAKLVDGQSTSTRPIRACIAIAGGGSNSASAIASTPGASSLLLESVVTYDRRSFAEFVSQNIDAGDDGWLSELESMEDTSRHSSNGGSSANSNGSFHFCSAQAAILLSKSALNRSLQLSPSFQDRCLNCIGVGSASSLVGLPSPNPDDNERRSKRKSRAYVACSSLRDGTMVWEVELANGLIAEAEQTDAQSRRTRSQEEAIVSNLILAAMMKSCEGTNSNGAEPTQQTMIAQILSKEGDAISTQMFTSNGSKSEPPTQSPAGGARKISNGKSNVVVVVPDQGKMKALYSDEQIPMQSDVLIIPGSFNPPHTGHAQLANAAVAALQRIRQSETAENNSNHPPGSLHSMPSSSVSSSSSVLNNIWGTVETTSQKQYKPTVLFEISVTNVDKPPIDPEEVERRLNLFLSLESSELPQDWGVILTNAPLFSQKTDAMDKLIKGLDGTRKMTFVIGTDTMVRIIDKKYYDNNQDKMIKALEDMKRRGVHFIVGGRLEQGKDDDRPKFINGKEEHGSLPEHVQQMFTLLEEKEFRVDISSTELRKKLEASNY